MALDWWTYAALGERLGISPEAVRQRAIRHEWSKRTGNDGRAEVRVDVEELLAAQPPAPLPKPPSDAGPTPDRDPVIHPADDRAVDALVASLREMVERADAQAERERERAADERERADRERERADMMVSDLAQLRERADQEREKAATLRVEIEQTRERADREVSRIQQLMSELTEAKAEAQDGIAQLRGVLEEMRRAPTPPAWLRWINAARAGRAS